ncbi:CPCC family cysteine-rich protein [Halorussus halophilus]|uniref:CPCC family cysteine-rich protein n=1 Tax=Halorussus halophilus TaxID=2650975 RepID=UPI0013013D7D|nr:CPCC family cysteine-rich protein [Halorussus halophilus]
MSEGTDHRGFCPVCGYRTLPRYPRQTRFSVCDVCCWEDDLIQLENPLSGDGANPVSLREARENFREFGACHRELIASTREPTAEEGRDPNWPYER